MEVREFVAICLILIAMVAVTVFVINVAWNLAEWITSAAVIVITMIGSTVLSAVLLLGSIIVGVFSWIVLGVVSVIVGLIVSIKKKCRKDK